MKWINTQSILIEYLSKVDYHWAEFWSHFYYTTDLDSIKSKLQLCNLCASYFHQNYASKGSGVTFINVFEESGDVITKPLNYFMFREGSFLFVEEFFIKYI